MESVLLFVLGVLVLLLGVGVSIGLHELGHFMPARWFGVKVSRFMIGFGPTVFSRRRGETEFGVKAIPLGGYIAMSGMYPIDSKFDASATPKGWYRRMVHEARVTNAETVEPGDESRTFTSIPVRQRLVIMLGGPFMNLVLAFVLFAIVFSGFGVSQPTTTVSSVSECVVAADRAGDECTADDPVAPAAAAGVMPGDVLLELDGTAIDSWDTFGDLVSANAGVTMQLTVERTDEAAGTTQVTMPITPLQTERYVLDERGRVVEENGEPVTQTVGFVGVAPTSALVAQPITEVPAFMWDNIVAVGNVILNLPQRMVDVAGAAFGGEERDPNGPISIVGVGRVAGEIASYDEAPVASRVASLVAMLGSLNIALFVFNLIPLMPLDGGHVAAGLWESIRRGFARLRGGSDPGPFDASTLVPLTYIVAILLMSMSALLIYADIVAPISLFG